MISRSLVGFRLGSAGVGYAITAFLAATLSLSRLFDTCCSPRFVKKSATIYTHFDSLFIRPTSSALRCNLASRLFTSCCFNSSASRYFFFSINIFSAATLSRSYCSSRSFRRFSMISCLRFSSSNFAFLPPSLDSLSFIALA